MRSDLSIVFVIFVGILAVFVLRDDIRHKKIRNRLIVNGLLGGVALFSVGLLTGTVEWWYFREVLMNASLSFLVAFVFWQFSLWPAGDAKLFALFSLLLPLHYYWRSYLPFFPALALLVNIFVVAYAVLILRALIHFVVILFRREVLFPDFIPTVKALLTVDGLLAYLRTRSVPAVLIGGGKPWTLRKVSCCPAKLASGRSSAVALLLTAKAPISRDASSISSLSAFGKSAFRMSFRIVFPTF